jgi:hypothetical protein
MTSDFRRLLPTRCQECVVDIVAWRDTTNVAEWPQGGWVNVGMISSHEHRFFDSWRGKLYRLGLVLKGESYPWLQFFDREDAERFATALGEAVDVAFPKADSTKGDEAVPN